MSAGRWEKWKGHAPKFFNNVAQRAQSILILGGMAVKVSRFAISLLVILALAGCNESKNPLGQNYDSSPDAGVIHGRVLHHGAPLPAQVMVIWSEDDETVVATDPLGRFTVPKHVGVPAAYVAMAEGKSGSIEIFPATGDIVIEVQDVLQMSDQTRSSKPLDEWWFAVYDTDSHGDVRFRYQFAFSRFFCTSWLAPIPFTSRDPNRWTSWDLSDFPAPWKGKKLLVPRRYRLWHSAVYGFSISGALFLASNR